MGRELFSAADRAVHRLVYAARRQATRETGPVAAHLGLPSPAVSEPGCQDVAEVAGEDGDMDEYSVLARAVQAHVVDVAEARLNARTRLGGEPMLRLPASGE
ncbi:hypothetical protein ABT009_44870 [Streptomyces sp. NPDC002896]|uniref:hypothetical protein n=1 Tax=Streptomyces sp. NPDC002896 TaxID=3154438 RepID=UPI003333E031